MSPLKLYMFASCPLPDGNLWVFFPFVQLLGALAMPRAMTAWIPQKVYPPSSKVCLAQISNTFILRSFELA
ncbi:hypothetical protein F5051DRAFT_419587 [Lentinula edodes]|nr:hypothetical protein F5051DRAFT_419587 [Lentinula edodes]